MVGPTSGISARHASLSWLAARTAGRRAISTGCRVFGRGRASRVRGRAGTIPVARERRTAVVALSFALGSTRLASDDASVDAAFDAASFVDAFVDAPFDDA